MLRLGILSSHPIQYQAPLFRELARRDGVDLEVLFCHDHGVRPSFDAGFGRVVKFDVPLLEGYQYRFLKNLAPAPSLDFTGMINLEVVPILARGDYDALLVYGYWGIPKLLALLTPHRRTRILMRGDSNLLPPMKLGKRVLKQAVLRGLFRRVDHFVAIGTLNARFYRAFGVDPKRITIAPFTVDNDYFTSRAIEAHQDRTVVRRRLGLPVDVPLFLCSAKLIAKKRAADVLQAFVRVRRDHACALAFVGGGELEVALREEAERQGVAGDVVFLGFRNQSELPLIYGASDVLVLASALEPWGLVVNEALASGLAVVVSDQVGSAPDLAEPEATFPVGDIDALAGILGRLVSDASFMSSLKARGGQRIEHWGVRQEADGVIAAAMAACNMR